MPAAACRSGPARSDRRATAWLLLLGFAALGLGAGVYVMGRPAGHASLLPPFLALGAGGAFGALGGWLPSFVHPFSFCLLGAAALEPRDRPAYGLCLGWWLVNVAFEFGQLPAAATWVAQTFADAGFAGTLARPLTNYLLRGTFDLGDLVAATLGALAAAAVLWATSGREKHHVR